MKYFISPTHHPEFNIAMEEYLLKNYEEDFFFLYQNTPSLIVGKHQNTLAEINTELSKKDKVSVIRRLSGGGTVYHDLGNLNYCLILKGEKGKLINFKEYSQPIIDVLQKLGVNAKFEGKSDLTIEGKKFSGNASHIYKNKVMQHGTMLFSSDLKRLNQLLKVKPLQFQDRGVRSIRSRVTNISEHLKESICITDFQNKIIQEIQNRFPDSSQFHLSNTDQKKIEELVTEKYQSWKWNYAYSPNYSFQKLNRFPDGKILEVILKIEKGIIKKAEIKGNCIVREQIPFFCQKLENQKHSEKTINEIVTNNNMNSYFINLSSEKIISSLL